MPVTPSPQKNPKLSPAIGLRSNLGEDPRSLGLRESSGCRTRAGQRLHQRASDDRSGRAAHRARAGADRSGEATGRHAASVGAMTRGSPHAHSACRRRRGVADTNGGKDDGAYAGAVARVQCRLPGAARRSSDLRCWAGRVPHPFAQVRAGNTDDGLPEQTPANAHLIAAGTQPGTAAGDAAWAAAWDAAWAAAWDALTATPA